MGLTHQRKNDREMESAGTSLDSEAADASHLIIGSKQKTPAVQVASHVFDLHEPQQAVLQAGDSLYGTLENAIQLRTSQLRDELADGSGTNTGPSAQPGSSAAATRPLPHTTGLSTVSTSVALSSAEVAPAATSSISGVHQQAVGGEGSSNGDPLQGRLGPKCVSIDARHASGQLSYGPGGLTVESLANFSSCRATVCVYSGSWQYEVTVLTSGIQQLGWCTAVCPFTAEEGVGDAPDSYAFDGKRLRKWSVKCLPYGECSGTLVVSVCAMCVASLGMLCW